MTVELLMHAIVHQTTILIAQLAYVLADGMNPTARGSEATAAAIWATLQDNCLAQ